MSIARQSPGLNGGIGQGNVLTSEYTRSSEVTLGITVELEEQHPATYAKSKYRAYQ